MQSMLHVAPATAARIAQAHTHVAWSEDLGVYQGDFRSHIRWRLWSHHQADFRILFSWWFSSHHRADFRSCFSWWLISHRQGDLRSHFSWCLSQVINKETSELMLIWSHHQEDFRSSFRWWLISHRQGDFRSHSSWWICGWSHRGWPGRHRTSLDPTDHRG